MRTFALNNSIFLHSHISLLLIFLFARLSYIATIPVDNGVEGEPTIECGAEAIEITFKTRYFDNISFAILII